MNQDSISSTNSQDLTLSGGGNTTSTTGFPTGSTCTSSGTYRASNKYMDIIALYVVGEIFRAFCDGRKTTWYPLTGSLSTNKEGSFSSVKVDAGTI
jgi:hypothetical protein